MREKASAFAASISMREDTVKITLEGDMSVHTISVLESRLAMITPSSIDKIIWNFSALTAIDTAAALMILDFNRKTSQNSAVFLDASEAILEILESVAHGMVTSRAESSGAPGWLEKLGRETHSTYTLLLDFLAFVGHAIHAFYLYLRSPRLIRYREIMHNMQESALNALGVIALTAFLIGIVIAYQSAVQLKLYGANIFIVDMLGISIMRELAPLMTAIVIAGRSGSAFAAQIGVMKLTEELDAMRTMGFDVYRFLVLPRLIALVLLMPLLIFFADIVALLGGMIVAHAELGIGSDLFMERFVSVIDIRHFYIGIIKGPFFAFLIASIGIFRGLMVKNDTQSIGLNTTGSVVNAIFAVIICDALFSILFTNMGL